MKKNLLFLIFTLFVSCSEDKKEIPDIDSPDEMKENLTFGSKKIFLTPNQLHQNVPIQANIEFEMKMEDDTDGWITSELSSTSLSIKSYPNNTENERSARFIIFNETYQLHDTLEVIQNVNPERLALIKIYKALNGDNWTNKKNWCSDRPLEEWEGIWANGDMQVTRLVLNDDAYIDGIIPECLGDLTDLIYLSFENTNVYGKLPESIGKLNYLTQLYLRKCNLSGDLPATIENCTQLEYVDLGFNSFTGKIPSCLFQCKNLQRLWLNDNKFSILELEELPLCHDLLVLSLSNNEITSSLPENLFKIKNLRFFYASNNKLTGTIPHTMTDALNLEAIQLNHNNLEGELPAYTATKPKIGHINVSYNNLSGKIPTSYAYLSGLVVFDANYNHLDIEGSEYVKTNPNYETWYLIPQK